MKHLLTFEAHSNTTIPKAVSIEQERSLMDKTVDKELSEEEKDELMEEDKDEKRKTKKKVA